MEIYKLWVGKGHTNWYLISLISPPCSVYYGLYRCFNLWPLNFGSYSYNVYFIEPHHRIQHDSHVPLVPHLPLFLLHSFSACHTSLMKFVHSKSDQNSQNVIILHNKIIFQKCLFSNRLCFRLFCILLKYMDW